MGIKEEENRELSFDKDSITKLIEIFNTSLKNLKKKNKPHIGVEGRIKTLEAIRDNRLDRFVNDIFLRHNVLVAEKYSPILTVNKIYYFKKKLDELLKTLDKNKKSFIKGVVYILDLLLEDKINSLIEKRTKI